MQVLDGEQERLLARGGGSQSAQRLHAPERPHGRVHRLETASPALRDAEEVGHERLVVVGNLPRGDRRVELRAAVCGRCAGGKRQQRAREHARHVASLSDAEVERRGGMARPPVATRVVLERLRESRLADARVGAQHERRAATGGLGRAHHRREPLAFARTAHEPSRDGRRVAQRPHLPDRLRAGEATHLDGAARLHVQAVAERAAHRVGDDRLARS